MEDKVGRKIFDSFIFHYFKCMFGFYLRIVIIQELCLSFVIMLIYENKTHTLKKRPYGSYYGHPLVKLFN